MARPGITFDDVRDTALALLARGVNPSIQRVREQLGTGSNSTIAEHLKRWQHELEQTPRVALPATVPEAVMGAVERFWQVASEQADSAYYAREQAMKQQLAAAEQSCEQARNAARLAQDEAAVLVIGLQEAERHAAGLQQQLMAEQQLRQHAEASIAAVEKRAVESQQTAQRVCAEAREHGEKLERALKQAQQDTAQRMAQAQQQLDYERTRGEANESRLMAITDQLRTEYRRQVQRHEKEQLACRLTESRLQENLRALTEQEAKARERNTALERQLAQLRIELAAAHQELRDATSQRVLKSRLVEALRTRLKVAARETEDLRNRLEKQQAQSSPNAQQVSKGDH